MVRALIILGFILIAAGFSFRYFKYLKKTTLRYFVYFLWFTVLIETTGVLLIWKEVNTNVVYNIFSIVSSFFYLLFFSFLISSQKMKRFIFSMLLVFIIAVLYNTLALQHFVTTLQTNTFILGFLVATITIILFFVEILNSDSILKLNKLPIFWISVGIFAFMICIIPVMVIANFIGWSGVYDYILLAMNLVMYGCFSYAFMLSKKELNN